MAEQRILFVMWAANLGGVQSSTLTRIRGLRRLGIYSDVFCLHSGAGLSTFAGVTTYVSADVRNFRALVRRKAYFAISFINLTPFVDSLRRAEFHGKLLFELRGMSEQGLATAANLSPDEFGAIVVPSRYVAGLIGTMRPKTRVPVHTVYNAVDTNTFRPLPAAELLTDGRQRILLWVGRLDRNKNFTELLHIVRVLLGRGHAFTTWVVSDTKVSKCVDEFTREVHGAGLTRHVRLLANVPRSSMARLYNMVAASGGCVLSTSRAEGLQNSLLEAMACGCPVVTSAVGGNVEIVADGHSGATYASGNPQGAADKIDRIFADEQLRGRFVTAGLHRVKEQFTPVRHAEAFVRVLEQVEPRQLGNGAYRWSGGVVSARRRRPARAKRR